ncbi:type II toxin-antitoxin system PrlF family antitoxin [Legionella pneumophila serogroup 2]
MNRADKEDPLIIEFLNFIAKDIQQSKKNLTTINKDLLIHIQSLIANVKVNLDEPLVEDENALLCTIENHRNT